MNLFERWFGQGPKPNLAQSRVLGLAQAAVEGEHWEWLEPTTATWIREARGIVWTVRSNANARGCNIIVEVLDATGEILAKRFLPR